MKVIVAFQCNEVTAGQRLVHRRRQHAKVGGDGHGLVVRGVDAVADAGYIVAGGKGRNAEIADVLFPSGKAAQLAGDGHDAVGVQKIQRRRRAVDRQRVLLEEGGQPLDVVAVLVGDEDARAVRDVQVQRLEGRTRSAHAFAHVDDEIPLPAAHHAAVAGGTGV